MRVLLIDHEDSFSYNLQQALRNCGAEVRIIHYNEVNRSILDKHHYIMLSPGPGLPSDYPSTLDFIMEYRSQKSIFGVCLGLQSIGVALGAELFKQLEVQHGIVQKIFKVNDDVRNSLNSLPSIFDATLYHSWAIVENSLPEELVITSKSENGIIMSFVHKNLELEAVQFHPESFLTKNGEEILRNWLTRNE